MPAPRREDRAVPEEGLLFGDRVWFYDARSPARRMAVSTHPDLGLLVLSLWQGERCTGTFRLPAKDGARAISTLVYGMAAALAASPPPSRAADLWLVPQETSSNGDGVLIGPMHEV
jgi:hypothetical protein